MPNIMAPGVKVGTVVSNAYQITSPWVGQLVTITLTIPSNQNTADRSCWFYAEIADSEAGPWGEYGGLHWKGGQLPGKDGGWEPSRTWTIKNTDVGRWVRGRLEVPVSMRCGIDIDLMG